MIYALKGRSLYRSHAGSAVRLLQKGHRWPREESDLLAVSLRMAWTGESLWETENFNCTFTIKCRVPPAILDKVLLELQTALHEHINTPPIYLCQIKFDSAI